MSSIPRLSLALLGFALCVGPMACGAMCTDVGCRDPIQIFVVGEDGGGLAPASFDITVEFDGVPFSTVCSTLESDRFCEPVEAPPGALNVVVNTTAGGTIWISVSPDSDDQLPDGYHLEVATGDGVLLDEAGDIDYESSTPNGPSCGPECVSAEWIEFTL